MSLAQAQALVAQLQTATQSAQALVASLTPADPPLPPPPPPPALPAELLEQRLPDRTRALCVSNWYDGSGLYSRAQTLLLWTGQTASLRLRRKALAPGVPDYTPPREYVLLVAGREVARVPFADRQTDRVVTFPLAGLPPGWLQIDVGGCQDGEQFVAWWAYHHVPGAPLPDLMPVVQGSHAMSWDTGAVHRWTWRPTRYSPRAHPLVPKQFEPVGAGPIRGRLVIATDAGQDVVTPVQTKDGAWCAHGKQAYFFEDVLRGGVPVVPCIDGPRGVGTAGLVLDIHIATPTAPGDPERGVEAYFMTANAWRKLMRDGSVVTLAGWVHDGPSYWGDGKDQRTLRLVGDWSAIPAARRGYKEPWGSTWLQVGVDETAAPIPDEGNLRPHVLPPIGLVADSGNNRILAHQFDPRRHGPEPVVTEWMTGLGMPFGLATWGGTVLVSERTAHRIVAIDPATRSVRRVIVQREPAMPGDASQHPWAGSMVPDVVSTLAERRAQPCLAPEMLRVWGDWLYYSSFAARCIKRVHLATGAIEYVCDVATDRQSWVVNFDVARDDSFAPAGTVFYATWGQAASAQHYGVLPGGARWTRHAGQAPWDAPQAYPAAVAVGGGRLYVAGSAMGMTRYEAGEPINAAKYKRGKAAFDSAGGWLRFGPGGFDPYGYAPPWGRSDDTDYYLSAHDLLR